MNGLAICAGVGGLELGLSLALGRTYRGVCYVEWEGYPASILVDRMEEKALDPAPIWDDLTTFDGRPWRGIIHILSAGFPCQPWSVAGAQKGTADDRWIWDDILRVIREIRPRWVFLENVPGLIRGGLEPVLSGLASLGYDAEWDLFSAEQCGFPHKRQRIFILAQRVPDALSAELRQEQGGIQPRGPGTTRFGDVEQDLAGVGQPGLEGYDPSGTKMHEDQRGLRRTQGPTAEGGAGVADAEVPIGRQHLSERQQEGRTTPRGAGKAVDDPQHAKCLQSAVHPGPGRPDQGAADAAGPSLYPPGPADLDAWARVLTIMPEVEPALCKLVDGLPFRVDELRALGNAVVPVVAAVAYLALRKRLDQHI